MSRTAVGPTRPVQAGLGRRLLGKQNENLWFWVFVGPFVLGLFIFIILPIGWSLYLSFFNAYNTVTPQKFVAFGNYIDMFEDGAFRSSLITFVVFAAIIVPLTYILSLGTAVLVSRVGFMQTFFRSVFFLPTACSYVVASLIWKMSIFSGVHSGVANAILGLGGHETIPFLSLSHPPWYWLVITTVRLWLQVGFYMILFLAGLNRISPTLYEAAAIDGAGSWQSFRYVTIPQLRHTSVAVLLLLLINAFQAFDEFFNILSTLGTYPPYARPPLVYLYYVALGSGQDFGHGSAGAMILTVLITVVAFGMSRVNRAVGSD